MKSIADAELHARLRDILSKDCWVPLSDHPDYGGTGAPGDILEKLLGIRGGNFDIPDAGKWEIKFHSRSALLTLFHLEGEPNGRMPKGHMHHMVREFGWPDKQGRTSFRHTIRGKRSSLGFYVVNESNRITVRHDRVSDIVWPYWTHDRLINAFAAKFRRLIVVQGTRRNDAIRYETAYLYREPLITSFVNAIERGIIAIDFDARTKNGHGLRNHGTKFRVKFNDLSPLYHQHQKFV